MTDTATRELAIVIPAYKDIYLRQTLQSIACQTHPIHWPGRQPV